MTGWPPAYLLSLTNESRTVFYTRSYWNIIVKHVSQAIPWCIEFYINYMYSMYYIYDIDIELEMELCIPILTTMVLYVGTIQDIWFVSFFWGVLGVFNKWAYALDIDCLPLNGYYNRDDLASILALTVECNFDTCQRLVGHSQGRRRRRTQRWRRCLSCKPKLKLKLEW